MAKRIFFYIFRPHVGRYVVLEGATWLDYANPDLDTWTVKLPRLSLDVPYKGIYHHTRILCAQSLTTWNKWAIKIHYKVSNDLQQPCAVFFKLWRSNRGLSIHVPWRKGISLKTTDNKKKLVIGYNIQSFVCFMLVWNPIIS